MITLRQLEIFVAVARHGSFRSSAEQLGISQVSVSEHMRALEDRIGRPLFERLPGGPATLTEAGQHAQRRVTAILADIGDFMQEMASDTKSARRAISLALHPFISRDLHDTFARFAAEHPQTDLKLDLDVHAVSPLIDRVESRALDLAYFFTFDANDAPSAQLVGTEELAVFVGPDHPLAGRSAVWPEELRDIDIVQLSPRNPLRGLIDRALDSVGAGGSRIAVETDEFGLILSSVHRNQGYVCMFRASERETGQTSGLRRVALQTPLPSLEVRVANRRAALHDPVLREIRAMIEAFFMHHSKSVTPRRACR